MTISVSWVSGYENEVAAELQAFIEAFHKLKASGKFDTHFSQGSTTGQHLVRSRFADVGTTCCSSDEDCGCE